jgi:hypothetical protein
MRSLPVYLLAPVLASCASDPGPAPDANLQMNDLSVLMPLPKSQAELDAMLAPTTPAGGGVLLPQAMFAQDTHTDTIEWPNLRVVAFRFDPCFGPADPVAHPDKCENQIRLVFQPLVSDGQGHLIAEDEAVHVFYKLTRAELIAAVQEMVAARAAEGITDDLGPLAVHPTLVTQGLGGSLAGRFRQIVTKYAGDAKVVKITSFALRGIEGAQLIGGEDQFWTMHGNDVAAGHLTPFDIAGVPADTKDLALGTATMPLSTRSSPQPMAADDITVIANMQQAMTATAAERQHAFDAALRIESPLHHSPNTTDCASCHMTQPSRELVAHSLDLHEAGNPNTFVPAAWIPAADLASTTHVVTTDNALNIHAFSYRFAEPMINQRVINETAANLAYLAPLLPEE